MFHARMWNYLVFILRQLQEKYLTKKKNLYFAFTDLEKASDRVPKVAVWYTLRKLRIEELLVKIMHTVNV